MRPTTTITWSRSTAAREAPDRRQRDPRRAAQRKPWAADSAAVLNAVDLGHAAGFLAEHTVTTAYYITAKDEGRQAAATAVTDLLRILQVVPIDAADFHQALVMGLSDFEGAVQAAAALKVGADYVVTRNGKDFRGSPVEPRTPGEVLALL